VSVSLDQRGPVEQVVSKDLWIVVCATGLIVILAGFYTFWGVGMNMSALDMTRMARPVGEPMQMGGQPVWTPQHATLFFMMWWVMMIAMMTPSASPMLLLYTALKRQGPEREQSVLLSLLFLTGYLIAWAGFSIAATGLQWSTEIAGLSNGQMMTLQSKTVAGFVLFAAGLYQFSSLKTACLKHCRSPAHFLAHHSRPGSYGALRTGMHHGVFCLGCCWALMVLLFVGGLMNLYWIVGLALYVLAEKIVPYPLAFSRVTGGVLLLAGMWFMGGHTFI
jgi:predicted metal-binding membrane protein